MSENDMLTQGRSIFLISTQGRSRDLKDGLISIFIAN